MSEDKKTVAKVKAAPAAKAKSAPKPVAAKAAPAKATAPAVKAAAKPVASKAAEKKAPVKEAAAPSKPGTKKPSVSAQPVKTTAAKPERKASTLNLKASHPMKDTIENMTAAGNEALKEGFEKTLTAVNEANSFHKDNVDAVIASATAAGKGVEAINANAVSYAKGAMEEGVAVAKKISSAKSVQEIVEIQTDFAKASMDAYLAELNKTTDLFASAMKDSVKPLNDRVSASVDLAQSLR